MDLTKSEQRQIAEILERRANEIAQFSSEYQRAASHFGSVEFALTREITRLRQLAARVNPPEHDDEAE